MASFDGILKIKMQKILLRQIFKQTVAILKFDTFDQNLLYFFLTHSFQAIHVQGGKPKSLMGNNFGK